MTVSRIIFQDALVTITEINNADTVAVGAVGYWEVVEAQYAAGTPQANATVIRTSVENYLRQIETWLAANPNGAILTAQQTADLARMLVGLGRLMLGLLDSVGEAT